jgi:trans-aconitate methyltransferase
MMKVPPRVVAQFRKPCGIFGHLAGLIMATRPSNIARNVWTLELLDLSPRDHVLEVGFGPGIAIRYAAHHITDGLIVGVDHSQAMLRQASQRNAAAIESGRVRLYCQPVHNLPACESGFDKIFSANVVQFWDDPVRVFKTLRSRLAAGGVLATTYMPRHAGATLGDVRNTAATISAQLQAAGLSRIRVEETRTQRSPMVCVLAVNRS